MMKLIYFYSILLLLLNFSCKIQKAENAMDQEEVMLIEDLNVKNAEIAATYISATFYAGSTDYFFKTKEDKLFKINVLNEPEEQAVKLPKNLLDPNKNLEGPPGANPKLIGKKFIVKTDENGAAKELYQVK